MVLHYRFWPEIRATLDALLGQSEPPDVVLVVDNGSEDGLGGEFEAAYPGIELLRAPANDGYAAGMNLGMRRLQADGLGAFLLLTHECVMETGCLHHLKARMAANPRLGAAGPLLRRLGSPDAIWSAGGAVDPRTGMPVHLGAGERAHDWTNRPPSKVTWLDGACILVRADAVAACGPLDERYFLYFEDAEYGARLRSHGWEIECVPGAVAAQESSELPMYLSVRNRLGFLAATAPRSLLAAELGRLALNLGRDLARPSSAPQRVDLPERVDGFLDFLRGRWGRPSQG